MIQLTENSFCPTLQAVIKRREGIKQKQSGSVDAEAHYFPRIALLRRYHHHDYQAHQRRCRADEMADTVKKLAFIHSHHAEIGLILKN